MKPTTTTKKKSNNAFLYAGIAGVAIFGIASASASTPKKEKIGGETFNNPTPQQTNSTNSTTSPPKPIVINRNLVLKKGSKGNEVKELQKLLKVSSDGSFGPATEAALFKLKQVKQITLNTFNTIPNFNYNKIPVGSTVMANNPKGTKLYGNKALVNGAHVSTNEVEYTVEYGKHIGVVKGSNSYGNWYRVEYRAWYSLDFFWVRAEDILKYIKP